MIDLAQFCGCPRDTRFLIIHADDLGMAESVNRATIDAFARGAITSASIMPPCSHFRSAAASVIASSLPMDVGVHLTITSEWPGYFWGPISGLTSDSGIIRKTGAFWPTNRNIGLVDHSALE